MDTSEDLLTQAHEHSMHNRPFVTGRVRCGCFYCQQTYAADEIKDWTHDGQTAICPRCGVDAVLSAHTDPLAADFLDQMHARWFKHTVQLALTDPVSGSSLHHETLVAALPVYSMAGWKMNTSCPVCCANARS